MNKPNLMNPETRAAAVALSALIHKRAREGGSVVRLDDPDAYEVAHALVLATVATIAAMLDDEPHGDTHG